MVNLDGSTEYNSSQQWVQQNLEPVSSQVGESIISNPVLVLLLGIFRSAWVANNPPRNVYELVGGVTQGTVGGNTGDSTVGE